MKKMLKKEKGLSTIVSTLLILLLVFVAVALLWVVVRNLVNSGTDQLDLTSKCLESEISITKVNDTGTGNYLIIVSRSAGTEEIGGIKLIFSNEEEDSNYIKDVPGNIGYLEVKTISTTVEGISNPNKVQAVIYFLDKSGNQQLCQGAENFEF